MKKFEDFKTLNYMHKALQGLTATQFESLIKAVDQLFDKKSVSADGEYKTFKVTIKDIDDLKEKVTN